MNGEVIHHTVVFLNFVNIAAGCYSDSIEGGQYCNHKHRLMTNL